MTECIEPQKTFPLEFEYEDIRYRVNYPENEHGIKIVLADRRLLLTPMSWLESYPPILNEVSVVAHIFEAIPAEDIAKHLGAVLARVIEQ